MIDGSSMSAASADLGRRLPSAAQIAPTARPAKCRSMKGRHRPMTHSPATSAAWAASDRTRPWADAQRQKSRSASRPCRKPGLSRTGGGVYLCLAVRLDDAAESGTLERQRHVDRRQRVDGRRRKPADRFDGRAAVEAGQGVGPAKLVLLFADLFGRAALPESATQFLRRDSPGRRRRRSGGRRDAAARAPRPRLQDCGSAAGRHRPSLGGLPRRRPAGGPPAPGWPTAPGSGTRRIRPAAGPGRIAPRRPTRRGRCRVRCGRREVRSWPAGFPGRKPKCRPTASDRPRQG